MASHVVASSVQAPKPIELQGEEREPRLIVGWTVASCPNQQPFGFKSRPSGETMTLVNTLKAGIEEVNFRYKYQQLLYTQKKQS